MIREGDSAAAIQLKIGNAADMMMGKSNHWSERVMPREEALGLSAKSKGRYEIGWKKTERGKTWPMFGIVAARGGRGEMARSKKENAPTRFTLKGRKAGDDLLSR